MSRLTVCTAGQPGSASMVVDRARGRYSDELRGTQRAQGVRRGQFAGAVKPVRAIERCRDSDIKGYYEGARA